MPTIEEFLNALPFLNRLLGEALPHIQDVFGEININLSLMKDYEHITLVVTILTHAGTAEQDLAKMSQFDQWWVDGDNGPWQRAKGFLLFTF